MTFIERIQLILDETKLLKVQLAGIAGVTKGAVSQWLKNGHEIKLIYALNIERKLGYRHLWLMLELGPKKVSDLSAQDQKEDDITLFFMSEDAKVVAKAYDSADKDQKQALIATLVTFRILTASQLQQLRDGIDGDPEPPIPPPKPPGGSAKKQPPNSTGEKF